MNLSHNLTCIKSLINDAVLAEHRQPDSVLLLAVSKQQTAAAIRKANELGIQDFGENYFQEAQNKMDQLQDLALTWHFIGPMQSNKSKGIAARFDWVHSIDRLKIATLLSEHRAECLPPLQVCLQINLVAEETKSGVSPAEAMDLALAVSQLPHLKLRGLMTIPPPNNSKQEQYELFLRLTNLKDCINKQLGLDMDTLSMGMSDDLIPAIKAGATIVRIGRALFGERQGQLI